MRYINLHFTYLLTYLVTESRTELETVNKLQPTQSKIHGRLQINVVKVIGTPRLRAF